MAREKPKKWNLTGLSTLTDAQKVELIDIFTGEAKKELSIGLASALFMSAGKLTAYIEKAEDRPSAGEIKAALNRIHEQAGKLAKSLEGTDTISRGLLRSQLKRPIEDITDIVYSVHFAAKTAIPNVPRRSTTWIRKDFITELALIYKEVKGGWPGYAGPFFRIIRDSLKTLQYPAHSEEALLLEIRRVITHLKKS